MSGGRLVGTRLGAACFVFFGKAVCDSGLHFGVSSWHVLLLSHFNTYKGHLAWLVSPTPESQAQARGSVEGVPQQHLMSGSQFKHFIRLLTSSCYSHIL